MAAELASTHLYNDANLQEQYKLEDLTGKNGNTLTNNNSVAFNSAKFNNGADGGSSDADKSLSVNSALGYNGGAYAISLWVKINVAPSSGTGYDLAELVDATTHSSLLLNYQNSGGTLTLTFLS